MPSNRLSSTRFGSISSNFTSSGRARHRMLVMSEFRQTVLPEFVAPAMSRCGILARSAIIACPAMSRPRAKASFDFIRCAAWDSRISRR